MNFLIKLSVNKHDFEFKVNNVNHFLQILKTEETYNLISENCKYNDTGGGWRHTFRRIERTLINIPDDNVTGMYLDEGHPSIKIEVSNIKK